MNPIKICLDIDQCLTDNPTLLDGKSLPWETNTCNDLKYHQVLKNDQAIAEYISRKLKNVCLTVEKEVVIKNLMLNVIERSCKKLKVDAQYKIMIVIRMAKVSFCQLLHKK